MPRGRPKKLDSVKRLEGNPGGRPLNENAPIPGGHPLRPAYVVGYAAEVWDQIVGSMPADVYSTTDSIVLATFCIAADQFRTATEELKRDGFTVEARDGAVRAHPAALTQSRAIQTIAMLGARLGLDPVSRASMRMPKSKKESSKFEGLVNVPIPAVPGDESKALEATA